VTRRALGLDGCRQGWVGVRLADGVVDDVAVLPDIERALTWAEGASVGVDIPIGLLDDEARDADAAARARLPGRASSVFSAPPRIVLEAHLADAGHTYADANEVARASSGRGMSQQTWRLVPRIAEADRAVAAGAQLLEVHPEVAFAEVAGGLPLPRKTSWAGVAERRAWLGRLGLHLPDRFDGAERCAPDDVLDAAVVAWVADGAAAGETLETLPPEPRQHDRGRPVVIHVRRRAGHDAAAVG
jgi:predicted RNase H-like nuclease